MIGNRVPVNASLILLASLFCVGCRQNAVSAPVQQAVRSASRPSVPQVPSSTTEEPPSLEETLRHHIKGLKDESKYSREFHAEALGELGPKAAAAAPAMCEVLKADRDAYAVATALGKIGVAAVPHLVRTLEDDKPHAVEFSARALGDIGSVASEAVTPLLRANKKMREQRSALQAKKNREIPEDILAENHCMHAFQATARALGQIDSGKAVIHLTKLLSDSDLEFRAEGVDLLGEMGQKAKGATPHLLRLWVTDEPDLGREIVLRPGFIYDSKDDFLSVRRNQVRGLEPRDRNPRSREPRGREEIIAADFRRASVAYALHRICAKSDQEAPYRYESRIDETALSESERSLIPRNESALDKKLREMNPRLPKRTVSYKTDDLGNIGPAGLEAKAVVPDLIKSLKDKRPGVRGRAAHALAIIGKEAQPAVPALLELTKDENSYDVRTYRTVSGKDQGTKEYIDKVMRISVRERAKAALKIIDPVAAAKADEK